jgi:hypothetical protein
MKTYFGSRGYRRHLQIAAPKIKPRTINPPESSRNSRFNGDIKTTAAAANKTTPKAVRVINSLLSVKELIDRSLGCQHFPYQEGFHPVRYKTNHKLYIYYTWPNPAF